MFFILPGEARTPFSSQLFLPLLLIVGNNVVTKKEREKYLN